MMFAELKTAAEVREHARMIQRKINQQRAIPAPPRRQDEVPPPIAATPVVATSYQSPEDHPDMCDQPLHPSAPIVKGHRTRTVFALAGDYFGFKLREVIGDSHVPNLVLPRQIGCFVAHRLGASFPKIGRAVRRDHSTVCHACKVVAQRIREDDAIALAVDVIGSKAAEAFGAHWHPIGKAEA
jgi:hypothetical protein